MRIILILVQRMILVCVALVEVKFEICFCFWNLALVLKDHHARA
jgi:hypothetical protein